MSTHLHALPTYAPGEESPVATSREAEFTAQPVGMVLRTEMFLASAENQATTPKLSSP